MKATEVINYLNLEIVNHSDFEISSIKPPDEQIDCCYTLLTRAEEFDTLFTDSTPTNVLAVIPIGLKDQAKTKKQTFLLSENPRLDFVKGMHKIMKNAFVLRISKSAVINSTGMISKNIRVGDNVVIKGNIDIEEGCDIGDNVVISGKVKIGRNVRIKSGTIIGQKGFNFVYDEEGKPIEFIHIGKVIIGDNVEFGALNTVVQGTLGNTIVSKNVKTDDHVHIAHNVVIGEGTLITACAEISGSVRIGKNTWLGPNCSIIDHITIGDNVTIGIGAVILKAVPNNAVVVGNPGKIIKFTK